MNPDLERWAPDPAIRIRHQRSADVAPDALWAAAQEVRLKDARLLGRLISWRMAGVDRSRTFGAFFREPPFVVLEEQPTSLVSALAGRIWVIRGGLAELDGTDEFEAWDRPGTVKVVFANWAEPAGENGSRLGSEVRVQPVDGPGRQHLRLVAPIVAGAQQLIGAEGLKAAVRHAQR